MRLFENLKFTLYESRQTNRTVHSIIQEKNWELNAFSDFQGSSCTYGEAAQIIRQIHCYFRESGIQKGDKIALLGRNSSNWAISFLAILGFGAVSVPILPDFNSEDVHHILNHSESILLFYIRWSFRKAEPKIRFRQ